MTSRSLAYLATALQTPCSAPDTPITHISADSRQIGPGGLFVAYAGVAVDGHRFVERAIAAGANAVVGEQALNDLAVPYLQVSDGRRALGILAAAWYGYPSEKMGIIGVTGTDGKTTTSNILDSILRAAGLKTGLLTTVNARIGEKIESTGLHTTTPDAPNLQRYLRQMADASSQWAVLETTSHGLSQWRVAGVAYDIAIFTNITHEHMDAHGDYAGYLRAKARLIEMVQATAPKPNIPQAVILNADDDSYAQLQSWPAPRRISYGIAQGDVRASAIEHTPAGLRFAVAGLNRRLRVNLPLPGEFNIYNSLAAITAAWLLDISDAAIRRGMNQMSGIPGRMQRIDRGQNFIAIVDFAHTPYALQAALQTARQMTDGQVVVVFGSAGLRDIAKREMMGAIAGQWADLSIITAEDPRTESLTNIMEISARACRAAGGTAIMVADRYRAIQRGIAAVKANDVLIVCGKGHEQSMCFGEIEYPWDDRQALAHALEVDMGQRHDAPPFILPTW